MDLTALCGVCFASNIKMHKISSPLLEFYESFTNCVSGQPSTLCVLCHARLQRCYSFQQAAARAQALLTRLYTDRVVLVTEDILSMLAPVHMYVTTPVECINLYTESEPSQSQSLGQVKQESETRNGSLDEDPYETAADTSQVKVEYDSEPAETANITDSEEDVPLLMLRTSGKRGREGDKQKRRKHNASKLDAREVLLTDAQQKEAMSARAASRNYLDSPHRCTLCYRGFINEDTYTNHMEKHSEKSGSHVCPLCSMRYRTARLLRAHTHAAHSRHYICNQCGHTSNTRHQASDHARLHSGELYECKLCGRTFHARTSYLTHARSAHPGGAAHACAACGDHFLTRHGLRTHRARAHSRPHIEESSPAEKRYCAACDIQFLSRAAWATHLLATLSHRQLVSNSRECPICESAVSGPMSAHLATHERDMRRARARPPAPHGAALDCDQCPLQFLGRARLAAHVRRVHLRLKYDKKLVCDRCGTKCTSAARLRYHARTHTGERPHACAAPACGKRFADSNQLRIHARTHSGERPYACLHCDRRFAQKPALNRHYRVHTGAKPYTCELCSKSFSQSNSLHAHVKAVHLKMTSVRKRTKPCLKKRPDADVKTE